MAETSRRQSVFLCIGVMLAAVFGIASVTGAEVAKPISIVEPYVRATPPSARVGGGYMIIRNTGSAPDRLLSATSPAAKSVEIHSSTMEGSVVKMRHLGDGLVVPAKTDTRLAPGALHLMFIEPTSPFDVNRSVPVALTFEKAGRIDVIFEVRPFGR